MGAASQEAVTRIRGTGDRKLVLVAGYNWSGVQNWPANRASDWITDPAGNMRYEGAPRLGSRQLG